MHCLQVFCAVLALVNYAASKGYGSGGMGGGYGGGMGGYGGGGMYGGSGGYGGGMQKYPPRPYAFDYQAPDEMGNSHFRTEQGDGSGQVQGSYGYTDQQGLYRKVDYMADAGGFRANIKTNEPGVDDKENPADVSIYAQPPPAGIQEKYSQSSRFGKGGYGAGGIGGGIGGGKYGGSGGYGSGMTGGSYGGGKSNMGSGGFGSGIGAGAHGMGGGLGGGIGGSYGMGGGMYGSSKMSGGAGSGLGGGYGSLGKMGGMGGMSSMFSGIPRSSSGKSGY